MQVDDEEEEESSFRRRGTVRYQYSGACCVQDCGHFCSPSTISFPFWKSCYDKRGKFMQYNRL